MSYVKEAEETASEINPIEKLNKTAEKLIEYVRCKGNEKLSLVLSKSTDLLREMILQDQRQATFHDFFSK